MQKESSIHTRSQLERLLRQRGVIVVEDVRQMPHYGEPIVSPHVVIGLNLSGWVKAEYDMRPVEFRPHDISVVLPNHVVCAHASSADYHAMLVVISAQYFEQIKRLYPLGYQRNLHYHWNAHFHLTDQQFADVSALYRLLHTVSKSDNARRTDLLNHLLEVMFVLLQDFRQANGLSSHEQSAHSQLFSNFYDAITQHYRESREVRFYAQLFHLSSKHFSTIIRQQTGTSALQWINSYVIIQAKTLLRHQRQLTIQQVTHQLGFPDQASFSRFFKHNVGLSPTEYRERS